MISVTTVTIRSWWSYLVGDLGDQSDGLGPQLVVLVDQEGGQRRQQLPQRGHHQLAVGGQQLPQTVQTILAHVGAEVPQVRQQLLRQAGIRSKSNRAGMWTVCS